MLRPSLRLFTVLGEVACAAGPRTAHSWPAGGPPGTVPPMTIAPSASDISFDVDVGEPVMIAGQEQSAYIKITLGGFALPASGQRAPVNLALVLDRSGSMQTDGKLEKAKEAALMVIDRLRPDDVISVISFDSTVDLVVPATKANEKDFIRERIMSLSPRGSTALFAGVSNGLEELGKYLDGSRVNRMVMLSDGQANVGPSSPNELARLGAVAARQGITITTIGLGLDYNEDLMTQLALASDGNHAFAENARDLERMFTGELGDLMSVVAKDVDIEISFGDGVTPVRALGRDATITGHTAHIALSQLYASQQKYVLFEVKVPSGDAGKKRQIANVTAKYANMISKKSGEKQKAATIAFTAARGDVAKNQNKQVLEAAVEAIAMDQNRRAVALRDAGKVQEAQKVLEDNARYLDDNAGKLASKKLQDYGKVNADNAKHMTKPADWNRERKSMKADEHAKATQQSYH